jgi:hypothetical protein
VLLQPAGGAIRALVMAPTRELTAQIKAEAEKLLTPHGGRLGVQVRQTYVDVQYSGVTVWCGLLLFCLWHSTCLSSVMSKAQATHMVIAWHSTPAVLQSSP